MPAIGKLAFGRGALNMRGPTAHATLDPERKTAPIPMLRFLFPRLTNQRSRGAALFAALVAEARAPQWYEDCAIPDTIDGRFDVLTSLIALAIVRGERGGPEAVDVSVGLVERFAEAMDAEHRQLGVSDPAIGKTAATLYRGSPPVDQATEAGATRLKAFADRIGRLEDRDFVAGAL
jgi:hypothetical protein